MKMKTWIDNRSNDPGWKKLQEVIYQRALEIELSNTFIPFKREFQMPVMYTGEQIGERRVDF